MRVAVLAGGPGGEREISIRSSLAVLEALAELGWESFHVILGGGEDRGKPESGRISTWPGGSGTVLQAFAALEAWQPDAAFIAMHGQWGEDGRVQAMLDMAAIPYQGSGVFASALAMDKIRAKEVFRAHGLPVAPDRVVAEPPTDTGAAAARVVELIETLGLPLVFKTPGSGSSVGVAIADNASDAVQILTTFASEKVSILAEAFVAGREFTVPVLEREDGTVEALPTIEIRPRRARFFDYHAKYAPDETDEICPAPISDTLEQALRAIGLAAHQAIGCRGYSRTDVRVDAADRIFVLETNTLPGLTPASLLPKSAAVHGLSFAQLIARLIGRATFSR